MIEAKKLDDIFARRQQIEAPLDPNRYTALRRWATDPDHLLPPSRGQRDSSSGKGR